MTRRQVTLFILVMVMGITFIGCNTHVDKPETKPVYTVAFNANGAIGTVPAPQTVETGMLITLPEAKLIKAGSIFVGWSESPNGNDTILSVGDSVIVTKNIISYAQWLVQYNVTFNGNGASGTPPEAQTVNSGEVIILPDIGGLSVPENIFCGWCESTSGGGTIYNIGALVTVTRNMVFYAQWIDGSTPKYTVTFNANGATGGVAPAPQTVYSGISITVPGQGMLAYSGKVFGGWNTQSNGGGTNYAINAAYTVTENVTLYAKWQSAVQYTVTFNANGASGAVPSAQTVDPGTEITLPGVGSMSNIGKTFEGWNTNANGSGTDYAEGASYTVNTNATLYAKWLSVPIEPPGVTLADKLAYIASQFDNGAVYNVVIENDESLAPLTVYTSGRDVIINLYSASEVEIKTISLNNSNGYLFTVSNNITFILKNIVIQGHSSNNTALIRIASGGKLIMNTGSKITGNGTTTSGANRSGGILVDSGGTLTMFDGIISNNSGYSGGGIQVIANGSATMHGGIITKNTVGGYDCPGGAGVYIQDGGYFSKRGITTGAPSGIIYGNDVGSELANIAGARFGAAHAISYKNSWNGGGKVRNTTLGGYDTISTDNLNVGWE